MTPAGEAGPAGASPSPPRPRRRRRTRRRWKSVLTRLRRFRVLGWLLLAAGLTALLLRALDGLFGK